MSSWMGAWFAAAMSARFVSASAAVWVVVGAAQAVVAVRHMTPMVAARPLKSRFMMRPFVSWWEAALLSMTIGCLSLGGNRSKG